MLYEKYGVRQNCCATGAILDLDAYIDFVVLNDIARPLLITSSQQGTAPPKAASGLYSVQIAPLPHEGAATPGMIVSDRALGGDRAEDRGL